MKNRCIPAYLLLALSLFSCRNNQAAKDDAVTPAADNGIRMDTSNVSFKQQILPIFSQNCATRGCHSGTRPAASLNLEETQAYNFLSKGGSGYLDTINPRLSLLYNVLVSESLPMPPTGKLPSDQILLIEKWMHQNAKNN